MPRNMVGLFWYRRVFVTHMHCFSSQILHVSSISMV